MKYKKYFAADRTLYKAEVDQTMTSLHCQLDHITGRLLKVCRQFTA